LSTTAALPELFKSLADPSRLRILHVLSRAELGVGELAEVLGLAQSGVSRHLVVLKGAGLVEDRRQGTSNLFRLRQAPSEQRARELWPVVRGWLDDLPEAPADDARLKEVLGARRRSSREFFDRVAPHWDDIRSAQYGDGLRMRALLELIPAELTVLDVGTGTGFMLEGVARRVRRAIGVDAAPAMLEQARENLRAAGLLDRVELRQGEMEALPLDEACVDVVLANMALHHAEAPGEALAEMARVLRPGGRVVLTDLARHGLDWTREELGDAWPGFEPAELERRLVEAGFDEVSVQSVGTCTLERRGTRERHLVDVLLASGTRRT
jgi:ArsR family transcriptional regulator